jgi:hypothetical protein
MCYTLDKLTKIGDVTMQSQEVICECGNSEIFCIDEKVLKTFPRHPTEIGREECSKCKRTLVLKIQLMIYDKGEQIMETDHGK